MSEQIFVLTVPGPINSESVAKLRQAVRDALSDQEAKVVVLGDGVKLSVLKSTDTDA